MAQPCSRQSTVPRPRGATVVRAWTGAQAAAAAALVARCVGSHRPAASPGRAWASPFAARPDAARWQPTGAAKARRPRRATLASAAQQRRGWLPRRAVADGDEGGFLESQRDQELAVFLISQFALFVCVGALVPILPLYGQKFGLSQSSVGLLVSSPSVAKLLLNLPMGRLADSVGRKTLMVAGMVVCAAADVGTGLATALVPLVLSRLLLGAGISGSDTGAAAWVADATQEKPERRASFLGLQSAVLAVAFVLGPTLGGMLVDQYGMSSIFFTVAGGALLCALGYATLPELWRPTDKTEESPSFQELIEAREQKALAGISVAFYCGTACKISLIPSVANEVFGATPMEVGQLFSAIAALAIIGTLVGGRLSDMYGPRSVLLTCGTACTLGYVGAAAAVGAHSKEFFLGSLAVWAIAAAVKSPALQAFAISAAPENSRGAALSVPKTVGDLSYAVAPFALGAADDRLGPEVALALCAGTFAAGTVLFTAQTAEEPPK